MADLGEEEPQMNTDEHGWIRRADAGDASHLCSSVFICGFS